MYESSGVEGFWHDTGHMGTKTIIILCKFIYKQTNELQTFLSGEKNHIYRNFKCVVRWYQIFILYCCFSMLVKLKGFVFCFFHRWSRTIAAFLLLSKLNQRPPQTACTEGGFFCLWNYHQYGYTELDDWTFFF